MIKKWNEFIRESVVNPDSYLDMRMQEIKDLLDSSENSETLIYEWENKSDHELFVNFSTNGISVRYEFDIDDMIVTKLVGETTDFVEEVESMEEGIEIIEKDIHSILGISEKAKTPGEKYKGHHVPTKYLTRKKKAMKKEIDTFRGKKEYKKDWEADIDKRSGKRIKTKKSAATKAFHNMFESKYEESILLSIEAGEGNSFLKNRFYNLEINKKLMRSLDKKFNLNLVEISNKHKIEGSKVSEISKFLTSLGLKKEEDKIGDRVKITFRGHLSLKDLKKIKE
jgi:hypothetical protein